MTTTVPKNRREREVWEACDELFETLQQEGKSLDHFTGERIKEKLVDLGYKRGNPLQIYQYRTSWCKQRNITLESASIEWPTLTDPIARAVAKVREEIQSEAQANIEQIQKDAQEKIQTIERELSLNVDLFNQKHEEHQVLQQQYQKSEIDFQHTLEELQRVKTAWQLETHRVKHLEEQQELLQKQHETILNELRQTAKDTENQHQQRIYDLQLSHRQDMDHIKTSLENQRQEAMMRIDYLKTQNQRLELQLQKEQHKQEDLKNELTHHKTDLKKLQDQMQFIKTEKEKTTADYLTLQRENDLYRGEIKSLQCHIETLNNELRQYHHKRLTDQEALGRLKQKNEYLESQLKKDSHRHQDKENSNINT